jgi:hypothetical protein
MGNMKHHGTGQVMRVIGKAPFPLEVFEQDDKPQPIRTRFVRK